MVDMKESFGKVSAADVALFEERNGLILPSSYRRFLLENNGGEPKNSEFPVPGWGVTGIHFFFGLSTDDSYDLQENLDVFDIHKATELIPIAMDGGGWMIYLAIRGPYTGSVYFWDHKTVGTEPILIGEDFESFINSLAPDGTYDDYEFGRPPKKQG